METDVDGRSAILRKNTLKVQFVLRLFRQLHLENGLNVRKRLGLAPKEENFDLFDSRPFVGPSDGTMVRGIGLGFVNPDER
ncbi:hypothetical protein GCM10007100_23920 [Roseibacillus persicicus]|uniref:Uncharacterized protein n=1 Tax=Roseibacillus persicicus TaxID=454148 RepID=A0A918TNC4_9BACT|nr:hypothetical protein GCM10007100_23920 [Roseibacillus persicicus]